MEREKEGGRAVPRDVLASRSLFASMPSPCLLLDPELVIVAATTAFLRMTRTLGENLIGRRLLDVFPADDALGEVGASAVGLLVSAESVLTSGREDVMPVQRRLIPRSDGSGGGYVERHFRPSNHPVLGPSGEVSYVIHRLEDVTSELELERARDAAQAASERKDLFLRSLCHELRTPLDGMLGLAQLLADDAHGPLSTGHRGRVAKILSSGRHLARLLDDIPDFFHVETNGISVLSEPTDVIEVLGDVLDMLAPSAQAAGVRLETRPGMLGVPLVSADRTRLVQMLVNLGTNAIQYNRPAGRVTFGVSWQEQDGFVCVSVVDTGLGIPSDKQDEIFRPFARAGREHGPNEGSGIGLALTKRLAELMGGGVGFASVPDAGSEFWVRVPVHGAGRRTGAPPPLAAAADPLTVAGRGR